MILTTLLLSVRVRTVLWVRVQSYVVRIMQMVSEAAASKDVNSQ